MLQELGAPPDSADAEGLHAVYRRLAEFAWEQVATGGPAEQQRYVNFATLARRNAQQDFVSVRLSPVLPAERPDIVDLAFKGLQLQSHSSVSAATMKGYVRRSSGDPKTRDSILRFLTMQADPSFAVGRALERVYNAGFREPAADAVLRGMFVGLDISYNESSKSILEFRKFIWSRAPDLR